MDKKSRLLKFIGNSSKLKETGYAINIGFTKMGAEETHISTFCLGLK